MFQDVERALARPSLKDVETTLLALTRERFRTQTAPDGSPWAALSPSTLASRRREGLDGIQALFATVALFASIDSTVGPLSVSVSVGGSGQGGADSVGFHQFGDGPPKRQILPLENQIPRDWILEITNPIVKQIGSPA